MLGRILIGLVDLYSFIILIYVLMSWIPWKNGIIGDIYRVLGRICDPYLNLFRRLIPPIGGIVDITPIIALIVLQLVGRLLAFVF